ncbi:hypothetical protein DH2020_019708 [Rehmannia glutinosa]|uniref:ZZ-type domain-containing protein n=1 Tax=Rehmannia glutinosa TaxID=99300 RepID=A0ABR0WFH6_REHGL
MDTFQESHCPVCRNPYNHFPRICKLLHVLLLKLYPSAYKRKERQVAEEEKQYGHASPECDGSLTDSQFGDHSIIQENSKSTFPGEVNTTTIPTTSSSHTITNKANGVVEHSNQALVTDLQCAVCKNLLCRPVVLNCGHGMSFQNIPTTQKKCTIDTHSLIVLRVAVYCEACIDPHDSVCKCPVCQSAHPNGFPSVCLVLEHFLEERFPEEYSARKESLRNFQSASASGMPQDSTEKQEQVQCSPVPTNVCSTWFSDHGAKFHPGVGCDYCGMCPIIGLRYKCKDCVERIGFDLCEGCYNSSSKLPGRFNQQHTQEHQFVIVRPHYLRNIILSLGAENLGEYDFVATNPSTPEEVLTIANLPNDALENELESTAYLNSSDEDSHGLEDSMTSPNSSNNHSEDQDCDFAS